MRLRPDYDAHILHTVVAEKRSELWRTVAGVVAIVVLYVLFTQLYQMVIFAFASDGPAFANTLIAGATPVAMYILLGSFALISAAVFVVVRVLHHREALSVMGPVALCIPQFMRVTGALIFLGIVLSVLPPYGYADPLVPNMAVGVWTALLPLSLLAVFVQISAEEIVFRGYLQQQLGARFRSPLVWMVLPSVIFALGHYQPAEAGENAVMITVWAFAFGMLMADLTARAGTIGPALAVHFVNNVTALVITSLPDNLGGLALWHTPFGMADIDALRAWLPVDFAAMLVSWLVARLALRR
ncbi:type II CAAX endopeptidase family protein [Sulfitobacter sp. HNIBRBA2951]|uniref:CPBP family intramembrane glutamic endopeptidase n=1 Tax=Sulfitobacter aquimarinus TaxID=3158557 RepID=UPI0032DF6834